MASARGYKCVLATPDDISLEKIELMRTLGAEVRLCPRVPFKDERHYVHESERAAAETGGVLMREFDNLANCKCHETSTGPEIWQQTNGEVDAFVCAVGTGGTIGGVSTFLRSKRPTIAIYCVDSVGSGIKSYLENGIFAPCGRYSTTYPYHLCTGERYTGIPLCGFLFLVLVNCVQDVSSNHP